MSGCASDLNGYIHYFFNPSLTWPVPHNFFFHFVYHFSKFWFFILYECLFPDSKIPLIFELFILRLHNSMTKQITHLVWQDCVADLYCVCESAWVCRNISNWTGLTMNLQVFILILAFSHTNAIPQVVNISYFEE